MSDWLDQAQRLLRTGGDTATHRNRSACWLARAGLESIVRDLLRVAGYEVGEASMRTQLSCLEAAYHRRQPQLAARTEYAWAALSRVSHQHAYELSPTDDECRHLVALVRSLEEAVAAGSDSRCPGQ